MLKQIGKFTVSEQIGRGTYSRVYRAVDPQGCPVAIKISTTQTEQEHLSEFQRDLVAAASVLHPNLVSVHDLGFEDESAYVVMELVKGRDLSKIMQSNAAISLVARIGVLEQAGEALKIAHERGVFHLNVRPSKIMLGDDGTAKLLDLGLGRLSYDAALVTDRGYLVGSPFYMSPERLMAVDTANAQCDIWSFGVTLHEWISGRHPFFDDDGERMIGNIMYSSPEEVAGAPAALNEVIRRALAKEPANRYRSFTEVLTDLRAILGELQRDESDAMLAEALKQAASGQWDEARQIARKMDEMEPKRPAASQFFGLSEAKLETEQVELLAAVAGAGTVRGDTAEERPESAPAIMPTASPLRPARAARASSTFESAPIVRDAASLIAGPGTMMLERQRGTAALTATSRATVRLLEVDEARGFRWTKIAALGAAALLVAGVVFLLWGPYSSVDGKAEIAAEAKAISPAGRVIKPSQASDASGAAEASGTESNANKSVGSRVPKTFDPKSLRLPVTVTRLAAREMPNWAATLKPPALRGRSVPRDLQGLPVLFDPAPPPADAAPAARVANPQKPPAQTVEALQAAVALVGGSFSPPVLVHSVSATYPAAALEEKKQGAVRFQATITKDGSVKNLQVLSGDPEFDLAAMEAVAQWKYQPALLNGRAVEVTQAIVVKFDSNK
jgi:eukaryotic-like serine/threonine-protein kinase